SGRTHGTKRGSAFSGHCEIDGLDDRSRRMKRGIDGVRIERGIGIEKNQPVFRARTLDLFDITQPMHASDLVARCTRRRVMAQVTVDARRHQAIADGSETIRTLRMVRSHFVQKARWMRQIGSWHW